MIFAVITNLTMNTYQLSARPMRPEDVPNLVNYWSSAEPGYLKSMGVDLTKLPTDDTLANALHQQLELPIAERSAYCLIWEADGKAIGHSNLNPVVFGERANMHLHLWEHTYRRRGLGAQLVKLSIPYFFEHCKLKMLFCEPYAYNAAPNRTLDKVGFVFVKQYVTVPGSINFEQWVNRWAMPHDRYLQLQLPTAHLSD